METNEEIVSIRSIESQKELLSKLDKQNIRIEEFPKWNLFVLIDSKGDDLNKYSISIHDYDGNKQLEAFVLNFLPRSLRFQTGEKKLIYKDSNGVLYQSQFIGKKWEHTTIAQKIGDDVLVYEKPEAVIYRDIDGRLFVFQEDNSWEVSHLFGNNEFSLLEDHNEKLIVLYDSLSFNFFV